MFESVLVAKKQYCQADLDLAYHVYLMYFINMFLNLKVLIVTVLTYKRFSINVII